MADRPLIVITDHATYDGSTLVVNLNRGGYTIASLTEGESVADRLRELAEEFEEAAASQQPQPSPRFVEMAGDAVLGLTEGDDVPW